MGVLETIASLITIALFFRDIGLPQTTSGVPDAEAMRRAMASQLGEAEQVALEMPGALEVVALLIIDPDLLDDLKRRVEDCIAKYRRAMGAGGPRGQQDVADKQAERCVCDALNRIKRRNDGKLPGGRFLDWWKSYRCVDDYNY